MSFLNWKTRGLFYRVSDGNTCKNFLYLLHKFLMAFFQWKINRKLWNKGCMLKIFSNSTLNKIENIPSKDIKGYNIRDWYKSKIFRAQKFQGLSIVLVGVVGGSVLIQKGNMQIKYALAHRSIFTSLFMS